MKLGLNTDFSEPHTYCLDIVENLGTYSAYIILRAGHILNQAYLLILQFDVYSSMKRGICVSIILSQEDSIDTQGVQRV